MARRSDRNATRASRAGTASPSALTGPSTRISRHTTTLPAMPARSKTRRVSSPFRTCSMEARGAGGPCSGERGDGARGAGELQDVQPGVGPIDDVDVAASVDFQVVGLDGDLAAVDAGDLHAALLGLRRDGRNVERRLARVERVADVHRAHAGVEVSEEDELAVIDRRERLVGGVRP